MCKKFVDIGSGLLKLVEIKLVKNFRDALYVSCAWLRDKYSKF